MCACLDRACLLRKKGGNEMLLNCIYNENKDEPYVCRMEDVNVCNGDTKMEMEGEDKFCFCFCDFCCCFGWCCGGINRL